MACFKGESLLNNIESGWLDNSSPDNSSRTIRCRQFVARTVRRIDNSSRTIRRNVNSSHGQFVACVINCKWIRLKIMRRASSLERRLILSKRDFIEEKRKKNYRKQKKNRILFTETYSQPNLSNTHWDRRCHNRRPGVEFFRREDDTFSSLALVRGLVGFERRRSRIWIVRGESCRLILWWLDERWKHVARMHCANLQ